jgi:hypothetical protein
MPITARTDGTVSYRIDGLSPSVMLASNRQKKVLRLFDVNFGPTISAGAAGWEMAEIMRDRRGQPLGQPLTYDIPIGVAEESRVLRIGFEGCRITHSSTRTVAQLKTATLAK